MRRFLLLTLVAATLFAGMISAADGHLEVLLDDSKMALVSDGGAHSTGLFDHAGDDYCCHSAAHFTGVLADSSDLLFSALGTEIIAPAVSAFIGLNHPPQPKPPRA